MKHFFTKFLFFVIILLAYRAEAHHHGHGHSQTDTLVRGTRSRPNGERSLRGSMVLSSEKHLKIKGFGDYEQDSVGEDTDIKVVLQVTEGGTLFIGSEADSIPGEFRITDNTLLIIEAGARLQIEEGSSLIVESGGGIIIKEGADLSVLGEEAIILKPDAQACIPLIDSMIVVIPPKGQGDIIPIDDCKPIDDPLDPPITDPRDSITGPIDPPWDPTDPGNWPSIIDSTYTNNLQGMVSTTPSGALVYQIPIVVPVGTAGMQPQLSIVYNSQNNASGILGAGFGLAGLSSISRVGKNFYHDNERTGVTLTMNDQFALDGQRLIRTAGSGPIGSDGNIFDTEITSFVDIQAYGSSSHEGPQRFQVRTKDGSTLEYGDSLYSRSEFSRQTHKIANEWHIRAQSDPNGNYIIYEYNKTGEYVYIKRIRYTGNDQAGLQPYNEIEFKYTNKSVQRKLFVAGFEIIEEKLLEAIICYSNNEVVKRYAFEYTADKKQLLYMRELDPSGRILGELKFEWKKNTSAYNFENAQQWTPEFGSGWTYNNHLRMLADVTGNGKADVVGFGNNHVCVGKSLGIKFSNSEPPWYHGYTVNTGGWHVEDHPRYIVDVNGDGLADIVGFSSSNGVEVSLSNGVNGFSPTEVWSSDFKSTTGSAKTYPRYLADFNGDGLLDIIAFKSDSVLVALNTGSGFSNYFSIPSSGYNFSNDGDIALVGDITGDGRADVILLRRNASTPSTKYYDVSYAISKGIFFEELCPNYSYSGKFFARPFIPAPNGSMTQFVYEFEIPNDCHFNCFLQDVNGDGMADLIFTGRNGLYVALAKGRDNYSYGGWCVGREFLYPVKWTDHYGRKNC
ncbi:MAG: FG-GAP-like repeat-containing protein [Bacteroidales bacterium]|nr:FG-GAP-like repeat-containing protein [Bacteroidales bacterium]